MHATPFSLTKPTHFLAAAGAIALFISSTSLAGAQEQVHPVADAYVNDYNPTGNYGTSVHNIASNYSTSSTKETFFKFDLRSYANKQITDVKLVITPTLARTVQKRVVGVQSNGWTETGLTWSNKPTFGQQIGELPLRAVAVGQAVQINLDPAYFNAAVGNYASIAVVNASSRNTLETYSRESSTGTPYLLITSTTSTNAGGLTPIDDTYVNDSNLDGNYGKETTVTVTNYSTGTTKEAFYKFDLSSYSGKMITAAKLVLTPALSRKTEKRVMAVSSTSWTETDLTWSTKPALGQQIGYFPYNDVVAGTPIEIEINPAYFQSRIGGHVSFAITNSATANTLETYSRESTTGAPHLVLTVSTSMVDMRGDIDGDGKVDGVDYVYWVKQFGLTPGATPRPTSNVTPIPVTPAPATPGVVTPPPVTPSPRPVTPSPRPVTPSPRPVTPPPVTPPPTTPPTAPPISATTGIWISKAELDRLPTSGAAWDRLVNAANSSWGSAELSNNNSMHDVNTLAGALVAARTNNASMRNKVIAGLQSAMNSSLYRALELSRGLQTYVIAADIIGYRTPEFETWVRRMLNASVSPHTGGTTLCNSSGVAYSCSGVGGVLCTAMRSANNWGGHARASAIASAIYLNDQTLLRQLANTHRAFNGEAVQNSLYCTDTTWHASSTQKWGINRRGTVIQGHDVSGVIPEDWRREPNSPTFSWPPEVTGYMWEALQGHIVSAVMLQRAGLVPFNSGDSAIVRAFDILYRIGNPPASDDTWQPWVVNKYAGTNYPTPTAVAGKNMGWTDWTHQ